MLVDAAGGLEKVPEEVLKEVLVAPAGGMEQRD